MRSAQPGVPKLEDWLAGPNATVTEAGAGRVGFDAQVVSASFADELGAALEKAGRASLPLARIRSKSRAVPPRRIRSLAVWSASALPLRAASVDAAIVDLPFGLTHQVKGGTSIGITIVKGCTRAKQDFDHGRMTYIQRRR